MSINLLSNSFFDEITDFTSYRPESFRLYGMMFQEAYDRSRAWYELSADEWLRGTGGGISIFFTETGKPSRRVVGFGPYKATVTVRFDLHSTIDILSIDVDLPPGLSGRKIDLMARKTSEVLCSEFRGSNAIYDRIGTDLLSIDWVGLSVVMEVCRGETPSLSITMKASNAALFLAA